MLNWLKKLLGLQPEPTAQLELPADWEHPLSDDYAAVYRTDPQTLEELDAENIELGRRADALREKRIANRKLAAALRDGSN